MYPGRYVTILLQVSPLGDMCPLLRTVRLLITG